MLLVQYGQSTGSTGRRIACLSRNWKTAAG